jgi:hypothetical protein
MIASPTVAKDPLTPSLSPQARFGELALQSFRIRKQMRMGETTQEYPPGIILAFLLPVRTRLRVRQQNM